MSDGRAPAGGERRFENQVALVTGGAGGIGVSIVDQLHREGAAVAVLDARPAESADLSITADVSDGSDVDDAVQKVLAELGQLDLLVCSAGVSGASLKTTEVTDDEWRSVFAVNCDGVFYSNRAAIPAMMARGYGRIVNIASIAGKEGNPMAAAYSASKAAVIAMTKSIGKDLAGTGILVNAVAPAAIRTDMLRGVTDEHVRYMLEKIPLGRLGEAGEVAELVCFLGSNRLTFSTGACFDISGGRAVY